jgi:hypothetical protein
MGSGAALLFAVLAQVQASPEARASAAEVRLADVAALGSLPPDLRARAGELEVARFARGQDVLNVPGTRLMERARGQLPALAPWLSSVQPPMVRIARAPAEGATRAAPTCLRTLRALEPGEVAVAKDFEAADCRPGAERLSYDRVNGLARTREGLSAGDLVRGLSPSLLSAVRPGAPLRLRVVVGPVAVEREVEILRPARAAAPIYVRGDDGRVFAAPAALVEGG